MRRLLFAFLMLLLVAPAMGQSLGDVKAILDAPTCNAAPSACLAALRALWPSTPPGPVSTPPGPVTGLTAEQAGRIRSDLATLRAAGVNRIRVITWTTGGDAGAYAGWDPRVFLSWPVPTAGELSALDGYLAVISEAGLASEVMILMPDSAGQYYVHATTAEYRAFVDAVLPVVRIRATDIMVGGDMNPVDNAGHKAWLRDMWPYVAARCQGCRLSSEAVNVSSAGWMSGTLLPYWNATPLLSPRPAFVALGYYPTVSPARARERGFSWENVVRSWVQIAQQAQPSGVPLRVDETGLRVGSGAFTEQEQAAYLAAAARVFGERGWEFNVWASQDNNGPWGIYRTDGSPRPAVSALQASGTYGVQYAPFPFVGFQFIAP